MSQRVVGKQSNNTGELGAFLVLYDIIKDDIILGKKINIVSDSTYAIRCVTSYGDKCSIKKWRDDIPNKELVKKVYELYKGKPNVKFVHIMAHTKNMDIHSVGNSNADKLAVLALNL